MDDILLDDSLLQYLGSVDRPADPRRPAVTAPLAVPGDPLDIDLQGAYFDMKNDIPLPESRRWSHAHTRQPSLAGSFKGDPQQRPYCTAPSLTSNYACPSRADISLDEYVDRLELILTRLLVLFYILAKSGHENISLLQSMATLPRAAGTGTQTVEAAAVPSVAPWTAATADHPPTQALASPLSRSWQRGTSRPSAASASGRRYCPTVYCAWQPCKTLPRWETAQLCWPALAQFPASFCRPRPPNGPLWTLISSLHGSCHLCK